MKLYDYFDSKKNFYINIMKTHNYISYYLTFKKYIIYIKY